MSRSPACSVHELCSGTKDGLYLAQFSPSADFIAASDGSGCIHVLQRQKSSSSSSSLSGEDYRVDYVPFKTPLQCSSTGDQLSTSEKVVSVAFSWRPESGQISQKSVLTMCRTDGHLQQFHAATGRSLGEVNAYAEAGKTSDDDAGTSLPALLCIDYAPDGASFATGGKEPEVFVFDEMTKKKRQTLQRSDKNGGGHSSRVCACKFLDGNLLATGGWDCTLQFWDLRKGSRSIHSVYGPSLLGPAALDVSGSVIVAGSYSEGSGLQCFDLRRMGPGLQLGKPEPSGDAGFSQQEAPAGMRVTSCQISSKSSLALGGFCRRSQRGFLRISDTLDLLLDSPCTSAVFAQSEPRLVACTTRDGQLRILHV
ncbi:unnamed protein product [Amoebophrya sp. A120]|nr:unnamed protein product [Amoebophrya sp. A120]|eukprot:GSA120T00017930001.1